MLQLTWIHIKGTTKPTSEYMASAIDGWNEYGVELRWKPTGLALVPATVFVSATTSAVTTPTTTPITTMNEGSEEKSPGFLTCSKSGTGFGVALRVILAILGIGFWIRRERKRRWKVGERHNPRSLKLKALLHHKWLMD